MLFHFNLCCPHSPQLLTALGRIYWEHGENLKYYLSIYGAFVLMAVSDYGLTIMSFMLLRWRAFICNVKFNNSLVNYANTCEQFSSLMLCF